MTQYTVFLFRSGRVYVREGTHEAPTAIEAPLLTTHVDAKTEISALGKVLLEQVDRANQPVQHVCVCVPVLIATVETVPVPVLVPVPCDRAHVEDSFITTVSTCPNCTLLRTVCRCT